jgi:hypothetical protein
VLLLVLAANWLATLVADKRWLWWISTLLILSTLVSFWIPLRSLLDVESGLLRFAGASALTFSPIFFANLIFSITFRDQEVAEHLFGWNLIGTTIGGIAEYASMALGYAFLGVLVAACYTGVVLLLLASGVMPGREALAAVPAAGARARALRLSPAALAAVVALFVGGVAWRAAEGDFTRAAPAWGSDGLLEAEDLRVVGASRPFPFWLQPTEAFPDGRWSKNGHMFASSTQPGDWIELELPPVAPGPHRLELFLTKAGDYGIVAVSVNGERIGEPLDLSSYTIHTTGPLAVGSVALRGRQDVLRLEVVGASPRALPPHYQFGIDGVRLTPEPPAREG